ncbi:MAG: DUF3788 domain-containing protein [candidate division WOR-3 bacterium]|nr:MAG: DUF3788 domain-containing protein [candidate division WOR-3 bacterium]
MSADKYRRLLDAKHKPTERYILSTLGPRRSRLWRELRAFLNKNYDEESELLFGGRKYGWYFKYSRNNKTLCALFPEKMAFSVLVILGKQQVILFEENIACFNENTRKLYNSTRQYHDGRWLFKRVLSKSDLCDVISLIRTKKSPKRKGV